MARGESHEYPVYYDLLEVSSRARGTVIRAAYHALMKEVHPDHNGGDVSLAQCVAQAYETLSDPAKRAEYDSKGKVSKGTLLGNYRILEPIAEGGFGTTYLGEHVIAHEPICIKHCHHVSAAYSQTLIEEAKAIWDLRHYSLPVMRDFLRLEDGSLALVMSYIPGPTLEQVVNKTGRVDPETVAWIAQRVLNALKYLHYHGVVHGDVKPQNIIVQPERHSIVIVDFGLSMVKPSHDSDPKGYTPVFAAPEQLRGSPILPESDFFSLGMTLLYALSGSAEAAVRMDVPENVPEPICRFIKRLLVWSVLERPSWKNEDLCESLQKVRMQSFGRDHSNMKPIAGF